jgi:hypothetical protein
MAITLTDTIHTPTITDRIRTMAIMDLHSIGPADIDITTATVITAITDKLVRDADRLVRE